VKNLRPSPFVADPVLVEALGRQGVPVPCTEDRVLFRQGEECSGLYVLRSGEAILEIHSPVGRCIVSFDAPAGSLMGLPAVLANQPYSATATAFKGSTIGLISRYEFLKLMESDPTLYPMVLQVLAAQIQAARSELSVLQADRN
jgi:CRP-like cAMP-binding protein